jgi:hypothetical protein
VKIIGVISLALLAYLPLSIAEDWQTGDCRILGGGGRYH